MVLRKDAVLSALSKMRESSKKRNFTQTIDMTLTFKGLDFKKPDSKFDVSVNMPFSSLKKADSKVLVFANDRDFASQVKNRVQRVILNEDISKLSRQDAEKLMQEYDTFLAEGPAMLSVAKHLGQVLAPKGRMPRLVTPSVNAVAQELSTSSSVVKVSNKKGKNMAFVHVPVGKESDADDKVSENILAVYNSVVSVLPAKEQNVAHTIVKLTMGSPIRVGEKEPKQAKTVEQKQETLQGDAE